MTTKNDGILDLVTTLIKSDKSNTILDVLLGLHIAPCVARELANEPKRREALAARRTKRKLRKMVSNADRRNVGTPYRRIIHTKTTPEKREMVPVYHWPADKRTMKEVVTPGSVVEFHATKGRRSYRLQA